jgi:hypothetical protein
MIDSVFIAGLHRSGTTLVHFLVGAHPQCLALGEVAWLVSQKGAIVRAGDLPCSCGAKATECRFWAPLLPQLQGDGDFRPVREHVRRCYGTDRIIVDSSKGLGAYQRLTGVSQRTALLYVVRDVRGWTLSQVALGTFPDSHFGMVRAFRRWNRANRALHAQFADTPLLRVSYDELLMRPEPSLRRVMKYLDLDYAPELMNFRNAEHHAVKCNSMKRDANKMAGLAYDYRWVRTDKWVPAALLQPRVMQYNQSQVYGLVDDMFTTRAGRSG